MQPPLPSLAKDYDAMPWQTLTEVIAIVTLEQF
jgi:hypothetical protein